jgi:carboxylesterase
MERPADRGAPFEAAGGPDAVLCLHGLTSTPYELRPICEALAHAGHAVLAPRIVGHGTTPEMLAHTRWPDWLATARRAFDRLAAEHRQVYVVGLSLGSLLGLVVAQERGARVAGVVAMAPPLRFKWREQAALSVVRRLPGAELLPDSRKKTGPDVSDPAVAATMPGYDRIPLVAAASMLQGQRDALDRASRLSCPVLVLHGRHDHVAPVSNARRLYEALGTPHKRLVVYPASWHILPLDVDHEAVVRDVTAFVADPIAFTEVRR